MQIPDSELILNPDGSIYHLKLHPAQIANTIITVGDQNRVGAVSKYFDRIIHKVENREFVTHTGELNGKLLTVISTGIGTDNIDIVLNELDVLVNIDFKTRRIKEKLTTLDIIRVGTSGCVQKEIPIDSFRVSRFAIGLEGMMHYHQYQNTALALELENAFKQHMEDVGIQPYCFEAAPSLLKKFDSFPKGITATCSGFYAPQGRQIRIPLRTNRFLEQLSTFQFKNWQLTNLEMETAGIYGLAHCLGHRAISISALLANRMTGEFSKQPKKVVERLIQKVLMEIN